MTHSIVSADELKQRQAQLKSTYAAEPHRARQTLTSRVVVDPPTLSVHVLYPAKLNPVGLHEGTGGDGRSVCPVELFLAGLGSCAGVTLAAVAHAMKIELLHAAVTVEGDADFCGTLGVNRDASVGLTALRINFELETDSPAESVEKLIELTHRYCVVHRTLDNPPTIHVTRKGRFLQTDK